MKLLRRKAALGRLQSQLRSGVKPSKGMIGKSEPLTEKDTKRINKEIEVLKSVI